MKAAWMQAWLCSGDGPPEKIRARISTCGTSAVNGCNVRKGAVRSSANVCLTAGSVADARAAHRLDGQSGSDAAASVGFGSSRQTFAPSRSVLRARGPSVPRGSSREETTCDTRAMSSRSASSSKRVPRRCSVRRTSWSVTTSSPRTCCRKRSSRPSSRGLGCGTTTTSRPMPGASWSRPRSRGGGAGPFTSVPPTASPRRRAPIPCDGIVTHDAVLTALLALPPRQRAAIVLRYYQDLTEAQTAEAMGCAVGTVKSQVAVGLTKLRETSRAEHRRDGGDLMSESLTDLLRRSADAVSEPRLDVSELVAQAGRQATASSSDH